MIDELIKLAKKHPGFREISDYGLRVMFETYKDSTLIYSDNGEIKAFAVYQDWPDCLNFIAVVGASDDKSENIKSLLKIRDSLPSEKMVCYFDEIKMELKVLCHQ
ncbi:hypothetical protein ES705_10541 [subsurface metagenome]